MEPRHRGKRVARGGGGPRPEGEEDETKELEHPDRMRIKSSSKNPKDRRSTVGVPPTTADVSGLSSEVGIQREPGTARRKRQVRRGKEG